MWLCLIWTSFIDECRAALAADKSHKNVREIVARAVSDPTAILKGLGEPKRSEVQKLYHLGAPHERLMGRNSYLATANRCQACTRGGFKGIVLAGIQPRSARLNPGERRDHRAFKVSTQQK
jgi:hypothetical protein